MSSGYQLDELVGKPHNMIRHEDMPKIAFQDMWQKLKAGKAWRGLVKNKCKNGDYYWVDAYVTPIYENGTIVGYQSVRVKPEPKQKTNSRNNLCSITPAGTSKQKNQFYLARSPPDYWISVSHCHYSGCAFIS